MWLFRKSLDLSRATIRPIHADDLTKVSRLFREGGKRYYGLSGTELPALLAGEYGVVLAFGDEIWGVALVSWPADWTCWLRGIALADGLNIHASLVMLLDALKPHLGLKGVKAIYYAGDDTVDSWLVPVLQEATFQPATEVIVYEKRDLHIPHWGNEEVQVRSATHLDLAEILRLDHLCFEQQWTKDDTILGPAIEQGPVFLLAELDGEAVGYAYATSHFGSRLTHLVRIAVDPAHQNEKIGVRLLAEVVSFAAARGSMIVTLNTQAYNIHAQRLYRWFGFAPTGERQIILCYEFPAE